MTDCEAWNFLVAQYNKNLNCKEEIVQNTWDMLFSIILGYSDSDKKPQYPIKMGSTNKYADFLIQYDGEEAFVVELKRHTLHDGQAQLFSYLKQLSIDIGILVCDKLYIYDFDYTKKDKNSAFVEIDFTPDNPDGIKFIELFKNENIEKQKIKDFIARKNQSKSNIASIKNELTQGDVVQIIKKHLTEKYPVEDVEAALADFNIIVSKKDVSAMWKTTPAQPSVSEQNNGKDYTKYTVNGTPTGLKGATVLAAVQYYVGSHPGITFSQLQEVFPDEAAPVFKKMVRRAEEISKGKKRFKYLSLDDGTQVGVTNQWTLETMKTFIEYAAKAGVIIKPID
jgi:hypothetical protein